MEAVRRKREEGQPWHHQTDRRARPFSFFFLVFSGKKLEEMETNNLPGVILDTKGMPGRGEQQEKQRKEKRGPCT